MMAIEELRPGKEPQIMPNRVPITINDRVSGLKTASMDWRMISKISNPF
jgi:hypothetical protein